MVIITVKIVSIFIKYFQREKFLMIEKTALFFKFIKLPFILIFKQNFEKLLKCFKIIKYLIFSLKLVLTLRFLDIFLIKKFYLEILYKFLEELT